MNVATMCRVLDVAPSGCYDAWLQHIAPIHWNHINLTGDHSSQLSDSVTQTVWHAK
jgi:hypothetical protein